jgi:hypothetical protein
MGRGAVLCGKGCRAQRPPHLGAANALAQPTKKNNGKKVTNE